MKHRVICLVALTGFLFVTAAAQAQLASTPYTYFEGSFQGSTFDTQTGQKVDGNGPRFEVSVALHENLYVFGTYEHTGLEDLVDASFTPPMVTSLDDIDTLGAGIGINTALSSGRVDRDYRSFSDRFSVFLDAQYLKVDSPGLDSNGYALDLGFRAINYTRLEFIGSVGFEKFEDIDSEFTLEGRLLYRLVGNLQIQGGVDWSDLTTKYFLGLRWGIPNFAVFKDRKNRK
jgi:hypothetical protein